MSSQCTSGKGLEGQASNSQDQGHAVNERRGNRAGRGRTAEKIERKIKTVELLLSKRPGVRALLDRKIMHPKANLLASRNARGPSRPPHHKSVDSGTEHYTVSADVADGVTDILAKLGEAELAARVPDDRVRSCREVASLEATLNHPEALTVVRMHLAHLRSDENLAFYEEVVALREEPNADVRSNLALHIFTTFIQEGGPEQVKVSADARRAAEEELTLGIASTFDQAFNEVTEALRFNLYPKFLQSPHCRALVEWLSRNKAPSHSAPRRSMSLPGHGVVYGSNYGLDDLSSLPKLLQSQACLPYFHSFLQGEYSAENLSFYLLARDYRVAGSGFEEAASLAKMIFARHIEEGSMSEITLSKARRDELRERVQSGNVDPDMFGEEEASVYGTLLMDSFPRFLRSAQCRELIHGVLHPLGGKKGV